MRDLVIWLNPLALFALVAVAAPVLIHILIQHRAERFPFPTLRFLQPARLATIRRHVIDDVRLLAVRAAILAAAAAALAGPLIVTAARRQLWERRVVQATVIDDSIALTDGARGFQPGVRGPAASAPEALRRASPELVESVNERRRERSALQSTFTAASLPDGIARAVAWLDHAPPARRELVIVSPFAIGSISSADVAAIPADIGVRLERTGSLPGTRTVPAGRLLTSSGVLAREVTLAGSQTMVRDTMSADAQSWPIDVVSSPAGQPAIDAAMAAVLSQRVRAPSPDRRARLFVGADAASGAAVADAGPIAEAWMADAAARIARAPELGVAAARVAAGFGDARFTAAPWHVVAAAADGRPLAVAAGSASRLIVASAAPASDVVTPLLLRAIANAIEPAPDLQRAEVVPIADAVLRQWSRPSAVTASPRIDRVDEDDRRWLWLVALLLLGFEMWMRRARRSDAPGAQRQEDARVA